MRLPVGETPPLGEENVSPNEGGEEQRRESSEDKRESPREKAGEGAQEWDEEICGSSNAARLREFEQLRRASRESLLAYYRRVDQLADVISCNEPRIVVAKFLDGLSRDLVGTVRDHTEPGHFKRDCPKLQSCTYCQRKGHAADDCYTKQREERSRGGRRSRIEALEEELRKLKGEAEGSEEEED
ncbi:hypothetical protein CLOP_g23171 [Closterium sp. NIES-67]|nr:hypothetical protein CLOP_g23171 [Closterium sp. NIES-67]